MNLTPAEYAALKEHMTDAERRVCDLYERETRSIERAKLQGAAGDAVRAAESRQRTANLRDADGDRVLREWADDRIRRAKTRIR